MSDYDGFFFSFTTIWGILLIIGIILALKQLYRWYKRKTIKFDVNQVEKYNKGTEMLRQRNARADMEKEQKKLREMVQKMRQMKRHEGMSNFQLMEQAKRLNKIEI